MEKGYGDVLLWTVFVTHFVGGIIIMFMPESAPFWRGLQSIVGGP